MNTTRRRIVTIYLPATIDLLIRVQEALAVEYPDAVVDTELGKPEVMHIFDGPSKGVRACG